jgi:hypothetical protein
MMLCCKTYETRTVRVCDTAVSDSPLTMLLSRGARRHPELTVPFRLTFPVITARNCIATCVNQGCLALIIRGGGEPVSGPSDGDLTCRV